MTTTEGATVGTTLRALREARGLSAGALARRVGASKRSMREWETDLHIPSGGALDRILTELETPPRERSRLLAEIAPRYARVCLSHTPHGAPVDVGQILRAMRLRQGKTQAEVARAVGVGQSALAKWETGDSAPPDDALHQALAALGATGEEVAALMAAKRTEPLPPCGLDALEERITSANDLPIHLREVVLLGLEAELWRRATVDPAADALLCQVVSARAHQCLWRGAFDELEGLADRALRLARASGEFGRASAAVYARSWIRQRRPGGGGASKSLGRWAARATKASERHWLTNAQALAMLREGDHAGGLALLEAYQERLDPAAKSDMTYHRIDMIEAFLIADQPEWAFAVLEELGFAVSPLRTAKVHLALGKEPPEAALASVRSRASHDWIQGYEAARVERNLVKVRAGTKARFA